MCLALLGKRIGGLAGLWLAIMAAVAADARASERMVNDEAGKWWVADEVTKSWTTLNGMRSNQVRALAQTPDGYLWVGTSGGLERFDGVRFEAYGEAEGISRIPVDKVVALPDGRLWVLNNVKESFWFEGGRFRRDEAGFLEVKAGRDGKIYGYDGRRIVRLPDDGTEIPAPEVIASWFTELAVTVDGTIWLLQLDGKDTKVWVRETGTGKWRRWMGYEAASTEPLVDWLRITADRRGGVWIGPHQGKMIRVASGVSLVPVPWSKDDGALAFEEGSDGSMWACPYLGGLYRWRDGKFSEVNIGGEQRPVIDAVLEGQSGEMWIGSNDRGLFRIMQSQVRHHAVMESGKGEVMALLPERTGGVLVGTEGRGSYHWTAEGVSPLVKDPKFDENCYAIYAFAPGADGSMWAGTAWGLYQLRNGVCLTDESFSQQEEIYKERILSLYAEDGGAVWVGRNDGRLNLAHGRKIEDIPLPVRSSSGAPSICAMEKDARGDLWLATADTGLVVVGKDRICRVLGRERGLPKAGLTALHRDASGNMWVGTNGNGLYRWTGERFVAVPVHGEQTPGQVLQIQSDEEGWLWLGTPRGICGLNVSPAHGGETGTAIPVWLGAADGMRSEQCTMMKAGKDGEGRLYFGTTNGFVSFDPKQIKKSRMLPRPVFEAFRAEGAPAMSLLDNERAVEVPPGARFEVQFTGLSPELAERMRFRYRLERLEPDWVELGARRFVDFSSVPPGKYRLELQASVQGQWNPQAALLNLRVRPFYWQTWWFRVLLIGTLMMLIVVVMKARERRRMERMLAEFERKRAVNEERERIARDLHDSLGAGITHAGILAANLSDAGQPDQVASRLRERLDSLGRELDTALWMTTPTYDRLPQVCDYVAAYAHEWFGQSGIRCRLDIADSLPDVEINPEARHHLFQAMKEAFNNIVKHADATQVWLAIHLREGILQIAIRDDGRGFDLESAAVKKRHGLKNLRQRMRQAQGDALIGTSPAGTTVELTLPLFAASRPNKEEKRRLFND